MGNNADGKLGIPPQDVSCIPTPSLVENLSKYQAVRVACGRGHTAVIVDKGDMFTWGSSSDGQLGLGDYVSQLLPQKVRVKDKKTGAEINLNFLDVDCGARHTIALTSTGDVFTMGSGEFGQLGTGCLQNEAFPTKVEFYSRIRKIAAGESHTLVLTENGKIYASGNNQTGQLGIGNRKSSLVFVKITTKENLRFKKVSAGTFSGAFCTKGELYLWGTGVFGEFLTPKKIGEFNHPLKRLSIGTNFGCGVDSKGNVYSWGSNSHGELGTGDFEPKSEPQLILSLQEKKITSVSCGRNFVIALGNTVQNQECLHEKKTIQVSSFENESRRLSDKEVTPNERSNFTQDNYYKERYSQIEKALKEEQNRSFDKNERSSSVLNRSPEAKNGHYKDRSRSTSFKKKSSEAKPSFQTSENATRGTKDRSRNQEKEPSNNTHQRSSNLKQSTKFFNSRVENYKASASERDISKQHASSLKSRSKEKSGRDNHLEIDIMNEGNSSPKNLQTASFDGQNSDNFTLQDSNDKNLNLTNKCLYERIVSAEKRGRSHQPDSDRAIKNEFGGYYQPRVTHFQLTQVNSGEEQSNHSLRRYEQIIEENKKEILDLKDSVAELRRQLFENEQNKARSIMLQEKIHGNKIDGMEEAWKEMQEALNSVGEEKIKLEKALEQEKQLNKKMASLLDEKDLKIKDLEKEIVTLTNSKLQQKSEGNELEKERDYYRRRVEDFMAKLEKQQFDFNDALSQKEEELEKTLYEKKELEERLNQNSTELTKVIVDRDKKRETIEGLIKTKEDLQRANKSLIAEKEVLISTKIKLENTIASMSNKLDEQHKTYTQMFEVKEQLIMKQQQDIQKSEHDYETIKSENQNLVQAIDEKNSQLQNLRILVAALESKISQKNSEIQLQKSRLIGVLDDNDSRETIERSGLQTPPTTRRGEEKQSSRDYHNDRYMKKTQGNYRSTAKQTEYLSDNLRESLGNNQVDFRPNHSPTRSFAELRSPRDKYWINRSPARKDQAFHQKKDNMHDSSFNYEQRSVSQRLVNHESLKDKQEKNLKRSASFISDSAIKKISKTANRLVEILGNEPNSKTLKDSSSLQARNPLSTKDVNEPSKDYKPWPYEDQINSNRQQIVSRTLQAVEIPLNQEEGFHREFYQKSKRSQTKLPQNKENSNNSAAYAKPINEKPEKSDLGILKSRLHDLQKNKNVLEQRMQEFEQKLKDGKRP